MSKPEPPPSAVIQPPGVSDPTGKQRQKPASELDPGLELALMLELPKIILFPLLFAFNFWVVKRYGLDSTWVLAVLWLSAVGTGFCLYYMRTVMRSLYGISEVGVGMLGCAVSLSKIQSEAAMVAAMGLAGSIYIIVRGLDNYAEGKKKRQDITKKESSK